MKDHNIPEGYCFNPSISDSDVIEAMKELQGYIDISIGDFREIYIKAYKHSIDRIINSVLAKDIMTTPVIGVDVDSSLIDVASKMASNSVSGVPVLSDSKIVGMISEKDFLAQLGHEGERLNLMSLIAECLQGKKCLAIPIRNMKASDIMSSPVIKIDSESTALSIASLFTEHTINRIPVVDNDENLAGIITRSDLVRAFGVPSTSEGSD